MCSTRFDVNGVWGSVFSLLIELPATCSSVQCCCQAHLPVIGIAAPPVSAASSMAHQTPTPWKPNTSQVPLTVNHPHPWADWPDQVNATFWYLLVTGCSTSTCPELDQRVAWYIEIPYQLSGIQQPQYDFSHCRFLKQTLSKACREHGALRIQTNLSPHSTSSDLDRLGI